MFSSAPNPYDELVLKATDENLASEDWALNMDVCDKVSGEGENGARLAIAALQKRLSHRNPNVQIYALELANVLAQNCGNELLGELSSRNWTQALDRLVNDRTTAAPVKKKALVYIKEWARQFEATGNPNLGLMGELYDQLRSKNLPFDEAEAAPESAAEARRREEEEELQRVLELSKQDKGGRSTFTYQPSGSAGASSSSGPSGAASQPPITAPSQPQAQAPTQAQYQQQPAIQAPVQSHYPPQLQRIQSPQPLEPTPPQIDINTATRVRAIYPFTGAEVGELDFDRGDVIKVLDRGFKEWWRGACNGKIGIFPVTYVEGLPELSTRELQEEAQEEARVFASLGLVDQLLQTLKGIDPARGDRLDDRPEIEEMYQASVALQGQINALIKKYSDQKAELDHMNSNFIRAIRQYEDLRNPPSLPPQVVGQGQVYEYAPQPQPQLHTQNSYYGQQPQQAALGQTPFPADPSAQHPSAGYPQQSASPAAGAQQQPRLQQQQYAPQHDPAQQGLYYQQSNSTNSVNRVASASAPVPAAGSPGQQTQGYQQGAPPQAAPPYPPHTPPSRTTTEPGVAGVGSGEHQQWDAYHQQQGEPHQQSQQYYQQTPAYGQAPQSAGYGMPDGRSYAHAAPTQIGAEGVTSGINRMSVNGP
ncbi:hypothetical protein I350_05389 [Cryptococcus amylolentus CBS 6273]|uniref:Class E vacuolar protein-sorting machinery protein HSE1 n=1 Tax=Cryptococcus amylolentus CBS 6273 TaxID=1296118 RepID=A0A1E3JVC2_9TREE|nr:hypothetical protein I350_05389 [Cryptococcus amylolentus CBS 6273]